MRWFRRKEPLHERLAREAGIDDELAVEPIDGEPDDGIEDELDEESIAGDDRFEEGDDDDDIGDVGGPLEPPPVLPFPPSEDPSTHLAGMHDFLLRPGGYDAFAWVDAPGVAGDRLEFVVLPNRSLIVLQQEGEEEPLEVFAEAVETQIAPPYRARARREKGDRWSVYARTTQILELPGVDADELEVTMLAGELTATVDGNLEPLYALADERGYDDFFARAEWLEDDVYEVRMEAL